MSIPLPSKKIVVFGVIVLAAVGGVLWYLGGSSAEPVGYPGSGFGSSTPSLNSTQMERLLASTTSLGEFNPSEPDPVYTTQDIKLAADSSTTTVNAYAKSLKVALTAFGTPRPYEAQALINAIEDHDATAIDELKYAQKIHGELITSLKKMAVPKDAATAHLELLNRSAKLEFLLRAMVGAFEAPVAALQSGREFIDEAPRFFVAIDGVNGYFVKRGFQFDKDTAITIYVNVEE